MSLKSIGKGGATMARYWVPHKEEVWVPAVQTSTVADKVNFTFDDGKDGEILTFSSAESSLFAPVEPEQEDGVDDICTLSTVTEGIMLHTTRVRYAKKLIYTRVARALIAVNPFNNLPIYDAQYIEQYRSCADSLDEPPHIFGVSQDALQGLRNTSKDQAILISGESGAGKTESAKLILSFVADAVRSTDGGIEERVLQTNPVLEAFGNAMTVRNNNSSRFGKWLDLRFCGSGPLRIAGCTLTSYLLETMRVCSQAPEERGFHIFHQLLQARSSTVLKDFELEGPKAYRYLREGQLVAPGVDDVENFAELKEAFNSLGFKGEKQLEIYRILAAILYLGNVDFTADGHDLCRFADDGVVKRVADHLQVSAEQVSRCLRFRQLMVGREVTESPLRMDQAQSSRDGLARLLYGRLFHWLISKMNGTLKLNDGADSGEKERLLGVLDIAGFESFDVNSLEQLMINLSNEHLQQHFIKVIFKEEIEDSAREGIDMAGQIGQIDFTDNAEVLAFIDGKGGILDLLDETMIVPKASDMTFVTKVIKGHEKSSRLLAPKYAKCGFTVLHFAGNVNYSCDGWLEKNADSPPSTSAGLMASSTNSTVREIGEQMAAEEAALEAATKGRKSGKTKSVTSGFRASLRSLMAKIGAACPHYIRCIKPNMQKVPGRFDAPKVMEQMILSGTLATAHIRQQGFAYRITHRNFIPAYRCIIEQLSKKKLPNVRWNDEKIVEQLQALSQTIVDGLPAALPSFGDLGPKMFAVGTTKVFVKLDAFKAIEDGRRHALSGMAVRIQAGMRGAIVRNGIKQQRELHQDTQALLKKLRVLPAAAGRPRKESKDSGDQAGRRRKTVRRPSAWPGESIFSQLGSLEAMQKTMFDVELILKRAECIGAQNFYVTQLEATHRRMLMEMDAVSEIEIQHKSVDVIAIEKALARARAVQLLNIDIAEGLEDRLAKLRTQLPLVKAMETALAGSPAIDDLTEIVDTANECGLRKGSKEWIPELKGGTLLESVLKRLEEKAEEHRRETERVEAERVAAEKVAEDARKRALEEEARSDALKKEAARLKMEKAGTIKIEDAEAAAKAEATKAEAAAAEAAKAQAAADEAREAEAEADAARRRPPRRARSATVAGLHSAEAGLIRSALKRAALEYDGVALEDMLRRAIENGMKDEDGDDDSDDDEPSSGAMAMAQQVLEKMQSELFLLGAIDDARVATTVPDPPILALKQLENLSKQLCTLPGYEDEAADASHSATSGLVKSSMRTRGRTNSVFQTGDASELELATEVFSILSNFSRLKPVKGWAGHNPAYLAPDRRPSMAAVARRSYRGSYNKEEGKRGKPEGNMLSHSKNCLYESLTEVPEGYDEEEYEGGAVINFRNILVCMGDRPSQHCQRHASTQAVVDLAKHDSLLRDEVYAQTLKQLNGNPSARSIQLGFELLLRLCQVAPPSTELAEFIRAFINAEEVQDDIGEAWGIAKACQMALDAPPEEGEFVDAESAELAAMAADVTQRLDEAASKLSAEVYRLSTEAAQKEQEIERLTFEKGKQAAEIAQLSTRATSVADQLGKAAERLTSEVGELRTDKERLDKEVGSLESQVSQLTEENQRQAAEIERLQALLDAK